MLEVRKLSEIAELTVGFVGTMAKHYTEKGVPFLRSLNIKPFGVSSNDIKYISPEFNDDIKKSILHEGDVVIVRTGVPGTSCVIPKEYDGCNCSDVVIVRPKIELVDPLYLCAYINIWGQKQISNNKVGAIQQHFNVHTAEEMLIALPDRDKQRRISAVISALNGKIDNNNQVCNKLETVAKTLYDYWFTQFDFPNAEGKPYRASGGEMVWNDQLKREIPKGWKVIPLIEAYDVCYGFPFNTEYFVDDVSAYPVVRIRDILEGSTSIYTTESVENKYWLKPGDMIIGMDGNFHINFWDSEPALLNQRCVRIRSNGTFPVFMAYFSSAPYIKARENNVSRTTVGHLSADDIKSLYVFQADNKTMEMANSIFNSILNKICRTRSESRELTKLRDWLLPMLMNGQATVE